MRIREKKNKKQPEMGTFKFALKTGIKDPREFYRLRLEYLKRRKEEKRMKRKMKEGKEV